MQEGTEVMKRPDGTMTFTNKNMSTVQLKAHKVILKQAWNDLRKNPDQTLFYFSMSDMKKKAGIKSTNNVQLKKSIKGLLDVTIDIEKDSGDTCTIHLVSQVGKKGELLEIGLPPQQIKVLLRTDENPAWDMSISKRLENKYSIALYDRAKRFKRAGMKDGQTTDVSIEDLKFQTGTTNNESYADFGKFRAKVLEPAVSEINEKTDIIFNYAPVKTGRKVTDIRFVIESKTE